MTLERFYRKAFDVNTESKTLAIVPSYTNKKITYEQEIRLLLWAVLRKLCS